MQADRSNGRRPSSPDPPPLAELDELRESCRVRGHQINVQDDTIAVLRAGANTLGLENAGLRLENARLLARSGGTPQPLVDVELARDKYAPARARAAIEGPLRTHVIAEVLERAVLIVSEFVTHSAQLSEAPAGDRSRLCAELSLVTVQLELHDPAPATVVAPRLPDVADPQRLGLAIVYALSERWGFDFVRPRGTRYWAQLTLGTRPTWRKEQ